MSKARYSTYEFMQGLHMSLNRNVASIRNKSDFNMCTARADMTGLLYLYPDTSTMLEDFYRNCYQLETEQ